MKSMSTTSSKFLVLACSPLFVGACAFALSACATQPAASTAAPATADGVTSAPAAAPAPIAAPAPVAAPTPVVAAIDFDQKVQPFFATYCFRCHGPNRQSGRTRFDTKAGILARVTPGDADNSTLVHMITATDDDHMPPQNIQEQPTADDIAMIKQWISEGAKVSDSYPSGT